MAGRYYFDQPEPAYGVIGSALARGLETAGSNFLAQQQLREKQRLAAEEAAREQAEKDLARRRTGIVTAKELEGLGTTTRTMGRVGPAPAPYTPAPVAGPEIAVQGLPDPIRLAAPAAPQIDPRRIQQQEVRQGLPEHILLPGGDAYVAGMDVSLQSRLAQEREKQRLEEQQKKAHGELIARNMEMYRQGGAPRAAAMAFFAANNLDEKDYLTPQERAQLDAERAGGIITAQENARLPFKTADEARDYAIWARKEGVSTANQRSLAAYRASLSEAQAERNERRYLARPDQRPKPPKFDDREDVRAARSMVAKMIRDSGGAFTTQQMGEAIRRAGSTLPMTDIAAIIGEEQKNHLGAVKTGTGGRSNNAILDQAAGASIISQRK